MIYADLIEKAAEGGSQAKLAREIGIAPPLLNEIKKGIKPCPPWVAARMAEIAGENRVKAAIEALADTAKSEAEQQLWARILKALKT